MREEAYRIYNERLELLYKCDNSYTMGTWISCHMSELMEEHLYLCHSYYKTDKFKRNTAIRLWNPIVWRWLDIPPRKK